jgi:hypothetical protein
MSPLLHTWTLSVEEQFYVVLPLTLFIVWKYFKKRVLSFFILVGIVSFACNVYMVIIAPGDNFTIPFLPSIWGHATNQNVGFYFLLPRAWEFIVGVVLAISAISIRSRRTAEIISAAGIVAIVYAITQFDADTLFPGYAALLPTFGAAAIIVSNTNSKTIVGKMLSVPALVWVGLISYSLYLWHWPVFVFANALFVEQGYGKTVLLIVVSTCLAWFSYRFVERPFGQRRYIPSKKILIAVGVSTCVIFALIGYSLQYVNLSANVPVQTQKIFEGVEDLGPRYRECSIEKRAEDIARDGPCVLGAQDEAIPVSFVVWGDSHAGSVLDTLDNLAQVHNVKGAFFSSGGCIPIKNVSLMNSREECQTLTEMALAYIQNNDIKNILLVSRWNGYLGYHSEQYLVDESSLEFSTSESERVFKNGLVGMVRTMNEEDRNVFILKQVPENENIFDNRKLYYASMRSGEVTTLEPVPMSAHEQYNRFTNSVFDEISSTGDVTVLDPTSIFCSADGGCVFEVNNKIIYLDASHINYTGSKMLEPLFQVFFNLQK